MSVRANFVELYLRGMRDRSMRSGAELVQEIQLTDTLAEMHDVDQPNCPEKSFRQMNGLPAVSCAQTFLAHRLLDPAPCFDDLLYLTALVAFVLTPTPRQNFQRCYLE